MDKCYYDGNDDVQYRDIAIREVWFYFAVVLLVWSAVWCGLYHIVGGIAYRIFLFRIH